MPQKTPVYLDENGEPLQNAGSVYLDENGDPVDATPAALLARRMELNQKNATPLEEPSTKFGGWMKGFKDYGKDLVSDPTTMAGVGSGLALATTPVTGPWGLAAAAGLGAAGGAGVSHVARQARSGPEDASDVLTSMGVQGAANAALTAVPPLARKTGNALVKRAASMDALQGGWGMLQRHLPATIAGSVVGPIFGKEAGAVAGGLVEAAQSPTVNRAAGRVLQGVGDIPDAMQSLFRRAKGTAATFAEDAAERRAAGLAGEIPRTRWNPKTATQTAREAAEDAARTVPKGPPRARGVDVPPPGEYSMRGVGIEGGTLNQPAEMAGGFGDVRPELARGARHTALKQEVNNPVSQLVDEAELVNAMIEKGFSPNTARRIVSPTRYDELRQSLGGRQQPAMQSLQAEAPQTTVARESISKMRIRPESTPPPESSPAMRSLEDAPPDTWVGGKRMAKQQTDVARRRSHDDRRHRN